MDGLNYDVSDEDENQEKDQFVEKLDISKLKFLFL